jgi:hypothetical protein
VLNNVRGRILYDAGKRGCARDDVLDHEDASASTPVLVSSTQGDSEIIRSLVSEALMLQHSPEAISGEVASLSQVKNTALAAFLVSHLEEVDTIASPDYLGHVTIAVCGK